MLSRTSHMGLQKRSSSSVRAHSLFTTFRLLRFPHLRLPPLPTTAPTPPHSALVLWRSTRHALQTGATPAPHTSHPLLPSHWDTLTSLLHAARFSPPHLLGREKKKKKKKQEEGTFKRHLLDISFLSSCTTDGRPTFKRTAVSPATRYLPLPPRCHLTGVACVAAFMTGARCFAYHRIHHLRLLHLQLVWVVVAGRGHRRLRRLPATACALLPGLLRPTIHALQAPLPQVHLFPALAADRQRCSWQA